MPKIEMEIKEALQLVLEMALTAALDDVFVMEHQFKSEQEREEAAIEAVRIHMEAQ